MHEAGLTVDWINDKVYWTENKKIMEFDINNGTASPRQVATVTGIPMGIGVYPSRNNS